MDRKNRRYVDGIIELHCHTKMSEGKGLIAPDELVRYAYDRGYKAIAITDCGNVQAFPEAYRTWLKLWNEYEVGCRQIGAEADKKDFLKVIYGLEGNMVTEEGRIFPVLLYAKNETGIRNLYRIVTASNTKYFDKIPGELIDGREIPIIVPDLRTIKSDHSRFKLLLF